MRYRYHRRRKRSDKPTLDQLFRFTTRSLLEEYAEHRDPLRRVTSFSTDRIAYEGGDWFKLDGGTVVFRYWQHGKFGNAKVNLMRFRCPACRGNCTVLYSLHVRPDWQCKKCWQRDRVFYRSQRTSKRGRELWRGYQRWQFA